MSTYNVTRFTRQVLKRYRRSPPSVVVHLYPNHFRFEHQHGNFAYDSPMKCFLESIREQKLPTDLLDVLDHSSVAYYDGCLIVEVHDHRHYSSSSSSSTSVPTPSPSVPLSFTTLPPSKLFTFAITPSSQPNSPYNQKAEVYRIVLAPNPATLSTELGILDHGNRNREQAIKMESVILNRTVPPLCLDPSIQTSRIANSMLRATTLRPPKRKRFCNSGECDQPQRERVRLGSDGQDAVAREGEEDEEEESETESGGGGQGEEEEGTRGKKERERHERLMKVGDEGIAKLGGSAFSRLAFIQSYRERQSNPQQQQQQQQHNSNSQNSAPSSLKAQPGSAITSIRLGGGGGGTQQQRALSPAVSSVSSSQRPTKKRSHHAGAGAAGGGDMSDGATSTTSLNSTTKKLKKSVAAAGGDASSATAGMSEKKQQRLNQKKKEKEQKKRLVELEERELQQQQQRNGGGGVGGGDPNAPQAKFTWSGSPQ